MKETKKTKLIMKPDTKSAGIENKENARGLLSVEGLDEMLKSESYKITFGLFSASTWLLFVLSLVMVAAATYPDINNHKLAVFGLILEMIDLIFYVIYAAMTSSKGIMRTKFAKHVGKKRYFLGYLFLGILYVAIIDLSSVYFKVFIGLCYVAACAVSLFAMRNNKVLEKLTSENEDDNE